MEIFRANTAPIFGLSRMGGEGDYTAMSFADSIAGPQEDLIFVLNCSSLTITATAMSDSPSPESYLCPWHVRNVLAYFALKGIGREDPNHLGKIIQILFVNASSSTGAPATASRHSSRLTLRVVELSPILSILLPFDAFPHGGPSSLTSLSLSVSLSRSEPPQNLSSQKSLDGNQMTGQSSDKDASMHLTHR
jgi:hypothetical protein